MMMRKKTKLPKNDLKKLAVQMKFPIVSDEGLLFLITNIKENGFKNILEIGSGIGYSALMLEEHIDNITTIEKNIYISKIAQMNIDKYSLGKITLINDDGLNLDLKDKFDLIFIDAAKAQYKKFFIKFKNNLKDNGLIICDNLNFHNLNKEDVSKNTKALLRKLDEFKEFLKTNDEFLTTFKDVGDGMSVSRRKG